MWKVLLLLIPLLEPASAAFLTHSDPLCRDESFFFFWTVRYSHEHHDHSSYDITGKCDFQPQLWYVLALGMFFVGWLMAFTPAVVNFIEGVERRKLCCEDEE